MKKLYFGLVALFIGLAVLGFYGFMVYRQNAFDKKFVSEFNYKYYLKGKGTPAEYHVNSMAGSFGTPQAIRILRGIENGDHEKARQVVAEFKRLAECGRSWPEKEVRKVKIPYGNNFSNALQFTGEYPLNKTESVNERSQWNVYWNEFGLHFMVTFFDNDIQNNDQTPWDGDSLEIFVMPEKRLKVYREVVIPPSGNFYTAINSNNKWGTCLLRIDETPAKGIDVHTHKNASGYTVTCMIPWLELPGYFRGNAPKYGEKIHFMLVRTNKQGSAAAVHSGCVPLLYGGHNIFGYIEATLK